MGFIVLTYSDVFQYDVLFLVFFAHSAENANIRLFLKMENCEF